MASTPPSRMQYRPQTPLSASPATTATLPTQPSSPPDENHAFAADLTQSLSVIHLNGSVPTVLSNLALTSYDLYNNGHGYESPASGQIYTDIHARPSEVGGHEAQPGDESDTENDSNGLTMHISVNNPGRTRERADSDAAAAFHLCAPPPSRNVSPSRVHLHLSSYQDFVPQTHLQRINGCEGLVPDYGEVFKAEEDAAMNSHNSGTTAIMDPCICDPAVARVADMATNGSRLRCGFCHKIRVLV